MGKAVAGDTDFVGGQAIKHEGVVRVRAVGDGNLNNVFRGIDLRVAHGRNVLSTSRKRTAQTSCAAWGHRAAAVCAWGALSGLLFLAQSFGISKYPAGCPSVEQDLFLYVVRIQVPGRPVASPPGQPLSGAGVCAAARYDAPIPQPQTAALRARRANLSSTIA